MGEPTPDDMDGVRTPDDMLVMSIQQQAERRVKSGESRAEVAKALGIPLSTVAGWAHRGGWRRKDLIAVRDAERGQEMLELIGEITAVEREKQLKDAAKLREALEASKAEMETIAPGGGLSGALREKSMPANRLAMALADGLLRQGRLEESDRAIRLAARFAEAEQADASREKSEWEEERERIMKWWAEQKGAYHRLHLMVSLALEEMEATRKLADSRLAVDCCPACDRRMDFWPEEVDRPGEDSEDDSDGDHSGNDDFGRDGPGDDDFHAMSDDDSGKKSDDDDFFPGRNRNDRRGLAGPCG